MTHPDPSVLDLASGIADDLIAPTTLATNVSTHRPRPQSLANGAAGVALLHIERALAQPDAWVTVHAWLSAAAGVDLRGGPTASLFFDVPALAFVTHAAEGSGRYQRAQAQLDTATGALTRDRLADAHARIDRGDRPALAEFDLIRGLTGLGAYHLRRDPQHEVTAAVLSYLIRLTEPLPGPPTGCRGGGPSTVLPANRRPTTPEVTGTSALPTGLPAPWRCWPSPCVGASWSTGTPTPSPTSAPGWTPGSTTTPPDRGGLGRSP